MEDKTVSERIDDIYFINRWGEGYFSIGDEGHLSVRPDRSLSRSTIDIKKVIDEIKERGVQLPCVVRFPEILRSQVIHLNETFKTVIEEADYKGRFMGVFPVKVNQMRLQLTSSKTKKSTLSFLILQCQRVTESNF